MSTETLDGGALDGAAGDWVRMSVVAELCRCTEFQLRLRLIARAVTTRWRSKPYARRYVDGCWYMRRGDIRRALRTKAPLRKQLSRATRHAVLQRDAWQCRMCRCHLNSATSEIDHVLALYLGGTDTFDNLQALCPNCHRQKTRDERPLAFG